MASKKFFPLFIAMLFFAFQGFSQDINGKWQGKIMNQFEITYVFQMDGDSLTGYTLDPSGKQMNINNGKIKGNNIKFTMEMMGNSVDISGKLEGKKLYLRVPIREQVISIPMDKIE
jgi:hypothetical protein